MQLNRLDFCILKLLKKKNCTNFYEGLTLREIMKVTGTARPTTYRKMMKLCKLGFVKRGCKSTQADTFFLLDKGLKFVETKGGTEDVEG